MDGQRYILHRRVRKLISTPPFERGGDEGYNFEVNFGWQVIRESPLATIVADVTYRYGVVFQKRVGSDFPISFGFDLSRLAPGYKPVAVSDKAAMIDDKSTAHELPFKMDPTKER